MKLSPIQTQNDTKLRAENGPPLKGRLRAPGDKSISHRALICGALATGQTQIGGLLEGDDVLATARALGQLGAGVEHLGEGRWRITGLGVGGFQKPPQALDFGNSGTGARLIMGLIATTPITVTLTGDASLCRRPMERVLTPLKQIGAQIASNATTLPLTMTGTGRPVPIEYTLPVPSAQVKSAILLAALNTPGVTTVIERQATRDHSERMLAMFGADIDSTTNEDGGRTITVSGYAQLKGQNVTVPGDPSSAAFPVVAALLVPGSQVTVENVLINPLRFGLYETLSEMGARIDRVNQRVQAGEPVADLTVEAGALKGVDVPAARAPSMIDEYPILAVAAACAQGPTTMRGLGELRLKESDRLDAMARGLKACGVAVDQGEDWLRVHGSGQCLGGAQIDSALDHRIAMAFLTLGLVSKEPVTVTGGQTIATSFPNYRQAMSGLGAIIEEAGP